MRSIRFISSNKHKIKEFQDILSLVNITVLPSNFKVHELQIMDVEALVEHKCLEAYKYIGRPVFVEHTGLKIAALNGFPDGLTEVFWETLKEDRFSELLGHTEDTSVQAVTRIAYCNGNKIYQFEGKIDGKIAKSPRGDRSFQWDCVFIPDGYQETFAEMGDKKNEISMRRKAIDQFAIFLKDEASC